MKKHWKKIILVLGIVFLSVAGYLVYIFQFKEYETADENVDKVIEEEYEVELPDGSVIIVDKDGKVVEDADGNTANGEASGEAASGTTASGDGASADGSAAAGTTEGSASGSGSTSGSSESAASSGSTASGSATTTSGTAGSSSNGSSTDKASGTTGSNGSATGGSAGSGSSGSGSSGNGSSGSGSTGGKAPAEAGVTVASIKQKYEPTLADIEGQASSRIGGLIGAAQTEYAQKKAAGESINYAYFYNKYVSAATELENRTDTVFYAVIGSLKNELKANGLAESHAESFVSEYEARKAERKKALLSKASGL
ncbi:hypothetical protein ACTL32_01000 [Planococcus sp. FY231025]|uniref:hypothetical protein n=1 Tax=Planococcus sp. FY231025 TaxID=3455699 RepID=UPI003F8E13F4